MAGGVTGLPDEPGVKCEELLEEPSTSNSFLNPHSVLYPQGRFETSCCSRSTPSSSKIRICSSPFFSSTTVCVVIGNPSKILPAFFPAASWPEAIGFLLRPAAPKSLDS